MQDYFPGISAFFGVLVGASVSMYVARLQFRANVKSKFRQDWIQQLRDNVAEYQSIAGRLHLMIYSPGQAETRKELRDIIQRMIFYTNRAALMLDLTDSLHSQLHSLMIQVNGELEKSKVEANPACHRGRISGDG